MHDNIRTIKHGEATYPSLLAEIHDPPGVLHIRGILPEGLAVGVVGTRLPTAYGKHVTPQIVEPLAAAGAIIVSGLAYGIDALAHEAALAVGGKTIAVLGTGVDEQSLYPQAHRKLAQRIVASGGAVISEYPPGTPGMPHHFPQRNRIIVGLSRGVVVIEARQKSGALITANLAAKENRDVFAVPGPITSTASTGPNELLAQGAKVVLSAADVMDEYELSERATESHRPENLSLHEERILDILADGAVHVDALGAAFTAAPHELAPLLMQLELRGLILNLGGGVYGKK